VLATSNHYDKLDRRIKSRFETYRIPRPHLNELTEYFYKLIPSKFDFSKSKISKIIESTNCDMKLSIIYINQRLLELIDPNLKKKSIDNFKYYINCLIQTVLKNDLKQLSNIRAMILTIYQSSLSWNEYLKKLEQNKNDNSMTEDDTKKWKDNAMNILKNGWNMISTLKQHWDVNSKVIKNKNRYESFLIKYKVK
jgi:hypothetical protein